MEKTHYLRISNQGLIDAMSFELIGASTKRDDKTKIGQFGSGLKYAIAWLMRNEIGFKIYAGTKEIVFTKQVAELRNQVFERIIIDGRETSYTTEMGGVDWEAWMAIREIWCNALDEGKEAMDTTDEIITEDNTTNIYIEINPQVQEVVDNWGQYFSSKREEIGQIGNIKIYRGGEDLIVYRRGVRCYFKKGERCVYHYDMPDIPINESRIIRDEWDLRYKLAHAWVRNGKKELLKELMAKLTGTFEYDLHWNLLDYDITSEWKEAIGKRYVVEKEFEGNYEELGKLNKPIVLPAKLTKALTSTFKGEVKHIGGEDGEEGVMKLKPTEKQKYMLDKAEEWAKECEYPVEYPIKVVRFNKKGILGWANDDKIYISENAFESLSLLIQTIIEENEHLKTNLSDETRQFQDHLIRMFLEEKNQRFAYAI